MARKKLSFEESMKRLEEIVLHLEKGDIPLQESIAYFEEGTRLLADCSSMLDEAEQLVVKLRKGNDGEPEELPFDE
ncbi:MAG: exodeoxyribonuclease VII small subunit [Oscillospiraceae bacterium]|nr:exodeoxyribonuclease VII small subunit [Oscillospiraceae bacterium]